jgi:upstream activation factor subunit UAF30
MTVPPEVRSRYISIIDSILEGADLTTITIKSIRQGIQEQVEYDITPQKVGKC